MSLRHNCAWCKRNCPASTHTVKKTWFFFKKSQEDLLKDVEKINKECMDVCSRCADKENEKMKDTTGFLHDSAMKEYRDYRWRAGLDPDPVMVDEKVEELEKFVVRSGEFDWSVKGAFDNGVNFPTYITCILNRGERGQGIVDFLIKNSIIYEKDGKYYLTEESIEDEQNIAWGKLWKRVTNQDPDFYAPVYVRYCIYPSKVFDAFNP